MQFGSVAAPVGDFDLGSNLFKCWDVGFLYQGGVIVLRQLRLELESRTIWRFRGMM